MAGAVTELLPIHFDQFNNKCLLVFTESDDYKKFLFTNEYAISKHSGVFCQFSNCKYHILLYSPESADAEIILNSLASITFTYINVDSLYGLYKHFIFLETLIYEQGLLMQKLQSAVRYNRKHPYMDPQPSVLKKRILRKRRRIHRREINTKTIGTQTFDHDLSRRIETILHGSLALDFIRIVDCMLDRNGSIDSGNINFVCK